MLEHKLSSMSILTHLLKSYCRFISVFESNSFFTLCKFLQREKLTQKSELVCLLVWADWDTWKAFRQVPHCWLQCFPPSHWLSYPLHFLCSFLLFFLSPFYPETVFFYIPVPTVSPSRWKVCGAACENKPLFFFTVWQKRGR